MADLQLLRCETKESSKKSLPLCKSCLLLLQHNQRSGWFLDN